MKNIQGNFDLNLATHSLYIFSVSGHKEKQIISPIEKNKTFIHLNS